MANNKIAVNIESDEFSRYLGIKGLKVDTGR